MNRKKATQTNPFCPLLFFGSHLNPLQHFLDLFPFSKCLLPNHFGKWTTFFHCLFFATPHHALRPHLGGYSNKYVRWISFKSNNPPSTNSNKKSTNFSTSTCWSTFAYVYFFSTCSSSLESLIIVIIDVGGEKCLQSLCKSLQILLLQWQHITEPKKSLFLCFFLQNSHYYLEIHEVVLMQIVQCKSLWLL